MQEDEPSKKVKSAESAEIAAAVAAFFALGGKIKRIPEGVTGKSAQHDFNGSSKKRRGRKMGEHTRKILEDPM